MMKVTAMETCEAPCFVQPDCCRDGTDCRVSSQKHVRFADEKECEASEVCPCCQATEPTCRTGKQVLVYELPTPPFDDVSITKRDYGWKPLAEREVPPWHPLLTERWRRLKVPSLDKSTYRTDYTPPSTQKKSPPVPPPVYVPPNIVKPVKCEPVPAWHVTSRHSPQIHRVCDKSLLIGERHEHPVICQEEISTHSPKGCSPHCKVGSNEVDMKTCSFSPDPSHGYAVTREMARAMMPSHAAEREIYYTTLDRDPCQGLTDCGCREKPFDASAQIKFERGGLI